VTGSPNSLSLIKTVANTVADKIASPVFQLHGMYWMEKAPTQIFKLCGLIKNPSFQFTHTLKIYYMKTRMTNLNC